MTGQLLLISANPSRKKRKVKRNPKGKTMAKRRSAAQRAATRKLVAANKARRSGGAVKRSRRRKSAAVAAPRARTRVTRSRRRAARSRSGGSVARRFNTGAAVSMLKSGAIGAGGAVGVDLIMGYAGKILPANMQTKLNADGTTNWLYYSIKAGVAVLVGTFGGRVMNPAMAARLGEGSLTVTAYELARGLMASSGLNLGYARGYMSPARVLRGAGMNKIVPLNRPRMNGLNKIVPFASNAQTSRSPTSRALFAAARNGRGY